MVSEIRIYYEGDSSLKPGFAAFFTELQQSATARRCSFRLISCGGGSMACRDFGIALKTNAWNVLLVDSERPDDGKLSESLCRDQGWNRAQGDSIFWMVEMMESWFHADKDALEKFYGNGFKRGALKPNPRVEEIGKKDLEDGLRAATRETKKGSYHKTSHGPALLENLTPGLVRAAAPNCDRLFKAVETRLATTEPREH